MISIIVPVYNSEKYLQQCFKSILSQTYTDLEILCVNDGSTDNSGLILEEMAKKDSRIKIFFQENAGVSAARNRGLKVARGEFIGFVDSDDEVESDMYEVLLELAQKYHADIAHCGYKKIHMDGSAKDVGGTEQLLLQDSYEASKCLLAGEYFTGGSCNKLYNASLLADIRFDTTLKVNEDVLFNIQAFHKAKQTVFWDVPKYHYFERGESSCSRIAQLTKKKDCLSAAEKMLEIYRGKRLESACASRVQYALLDLYRFHLMESREDSKEERDAIHKRICEISQMCDNILSRSAWNYRFMRYLPGTYRLVYCVYDRIRKPNWDL